MLPAPVSSSMSKAAQERILDGVILHLSVNEPLRDLNFQYPNSGITAFKSNEKKFYDLIEEDIRVKRLP